MKKKNRIKKLVVLASALATMGFGSSLYAAIFTAQANGDWNSPATWDGSGSVPTAADDVVINGKTITISGNGLTYAVKSLDLTAANSVLQPAVGEEVTLAVGGNITFGHANAKIQQNGTGKLNMNITSSAKLDLKAAANLEVNDLTLTNGSVAADAACAITIKGDLNITGTSSLEMKEETPAFAGINFSTGNHTVTVDPTAQLSVAKLTNEEGSELTTSSDITITAVLSNAGTFTANGGKVVFNNAADVCWENTDTGVLILNDVEFLGTTDYAPETGALVKGNFSNLTTNPGTVKPIGEIEFSGATQKEILNIGAAGDLSFGGGIVVSPGAPVVTSSSFAIGAPGLEVQSGASFKADAGGITFGGADSKISAVTPNSIEFNDLSIGAAVTTSSDFKILGNLKTTAVGLTASGGTITFENVAERTITSAADDDITFANMKVAAGSKVKNAATTSSFTVDGGGIEVEGTGSLVVDPAATVTFKNTNTIENNGTLSFGLVSIPETGDKVTTASDFTVTGATFTNTGFFTATDGTITFTCATPAIVAAADETKTVFNSITTGGAALTVKAISINGDLTVNGTSKFAGEGATAIVHFTGTKDQTIGGTSTATPAVSFPTTTVDKASGKLLLEKDVTLVASGALNLKNGIVDMGTTTLTANVAPTKAAGTDFGAIDGDKGTYVVKTDQTLKDDFFTVDGEPTLNNLTAIGVLTLGGDLTVNGNLDLQVDANVIDVNTLTVKGNLTRKTSGNFTAATGKLVLTGNGKTAGLSNDYFGTSCDVNLEVGRAETLGGKLTMAAGKTLYVNTGINYLDLGTNTLTTTESTTNTSLLGIERISGAIKADEGEVELGPTDPFTLPGNLFKDNTVKTLTIAGEMTLGSDLTVNGVLTNKAKNIITGDNNIMTLGPQSTFTTATNTAYIVGNLKQTVTNAGVTFPIGGGTGAADYNQVTLNFQTPGTTQEVIVSAKATEPTVGRAGNPENALDLVYTIKPVGTDPNDALNATFAAGTAAGAGAAKRNIAAKWENDAWKDYRNGKSGANDAIIDDYSIANSTALAGDWAVFSISQNYDNTDAANTAVDAAISTAAKNVVITNISPNPVQLNRPFKVTVQLQDQFGQPITTETPVNVKLTKKLGATTIIGDTVKGVITAGSSFTTLTAIATTAAANNQLQADDDATDVYAASVGEAFNVVADAPATQATINTITPANTTAYIAWTTSAATAALIVLKAGEPLTKAEYPVNGTTYTADALYGAGSQIGDAVVVAKGATAAATVRSLSPNTTYYAYAFAFAGSNGTESYKLSAASGNPKAFTTLGSNDDDVAFGENNTRETSRTIGTNTPVKGTIKDATDEDWFNFSVSSANPNVRAQLSNLPAGYNVEIYNTEGKRIRRGIRLGQGSEGPVINGLAAGTYTLKIYSSDGSSSAEPYTLKVGTKSSEIFSVTP